MTIAVSNRIAVVVHVRTGITLSLAANNTEAFAGGSCSEEETFLQSIQGSSLHNRKPTKKRCSDSVKIQTTFFRFR